MFLTILEGKLVSSAQLLIILFVIDQFSEKGYAHENNATEKDAAVQQNSGDNRIKPFKA